MKNKKTIDIQNIKDPSERDILLLLKTKGNCFYGDIIRELQISVSKGQNSIFSLIQQGFIKQAEKSSFIKLNVDIK